MDKDDEISFGGGDPLENIMEQKQGDGKLIKNSERPDLRDKEKDWTEEKKKGKKKNKNKRA